MDKKSWIRKGLTIGIILLFIVTSIIPVIALDTEKSSQPTSRGNWLYVGGLGPGNYTKIQDAINDANDGDTVYVFDDSSPYKNFVSINKSINLIGEDKSTTMLDSGSVYTNLAIYDTDGVHISGFTLFNSIGKGHIGIQIYDSNYSSFIDNKIIGVNTGIHLSNSHDCIITNNEIKDIGPVSADFYYTGIDVSYHSSNNHINNNKVSNHRAGIRLRSISQNNIVNDNIFTNCGVSIDAESYPNTFLGNSINNKPFLCLTDEKDKMFDDVDVGEVILINCENITIKNIEISNSTFGIELIHSDSCTISNSIFQSNGFSGISIIGRCENNKINDNYISFNFDGINVVSYYEYNCCNNTISNNIITSNWVNGLRIFDSTNNIVTRNTIQGNGFQPSYFLFGSGIFLEIHANNNTVANNIIQDNYHGISLRDSEYNSITYNHITNNFKIGLNLDNSFPNSILYNNMINNMRDVKFEKYSKIKNDMKNNYWDSWVGFGPKFLFGQRMIPRGYDRQGNQMYKPIPWIIFDWYPAQEPYDIPSI